MSERLPYEDRLQQHWTDLPLPDENKAWEDMRRRLEEDDDDRPIIAWWRRGCLLWGLLLLVIFGSGLWLIKKKYFTSDDKKKVTVNKQDQDSNYDRKNTVTIQTIPANTTSGSAQDRTKNKTGPLEELTDGQHARSVDSPATVNNTGKEQSSISSTQKKRNEIKRDGDIQNPIVTGRRKGRSGTEVKNEYDISNPVVTGLKSKKKRSNPSKENPVLSKQSTNINSRKQNLNPTNIQKNNSNKSGTIPGLMVKNDTVKVQTKSDVPIVGNHADTLTRDSDSDKSLTSAPVKKVPNNTKETVKTDTTKKKQPLSYSAGISLQQLLPIAGQKTVPYNSQGRKGTLADYIPSIYFRVNKEQKWFIQGEFRYGAPQYTREFVYKQERREDTLSPTQTFTTRTSNTLKKTYYHQLPVTFNYFLTKEWSVGAGLSWNKFVSAISDQEITRRNNSTSFDSIVSKGIVREKQDSATGFAKSYFQGVIESQYKWKRFSFGARYTFGLQPYLKFTLLNGETSKESNRTLQLFLRYELWQPKKKE